MDRAVGWEILPADLAAALQPELADIAAEMAREIEFCVPEYARPRDSAYARTVLMASENAVRDFVAGVEEGATFGQPVTEVFRGIGRGEARLDRSLTALQMAMHVGAEVIWRRLSELCLRRGLAEDKLCRLAEALFFHFRQNVGAAADGYLEEQTRLTGELQRRRLHLLDLVLSDPPVAAEAIEKVAEEARWKIPELVAVVLLNDHSVDQVGSLDLPPEVLADLSRSEPCLIVPDPDKAGRLKTIGYALRGWLAVVGPHLPLDRAAQSMRWAGAALTLVRRGVIARSDVVHCADHMSTLVLLQNEELVETLASVRLAPLAQLRPDQRDRLAETLLCWLQTGGDAGKVAARLFVHPQTVRYRIRQLQDLFGDRLRDPDARLELEMALRARRLLSGRPFSGRQLTGRAEPETPPDNVLRLTALGGA